MKKVCLLTVLLIISLTPCGAKSLAKNNDIISDNMPRIIEHSYSTDQICKFNLLASQDFSQDISLLLNKNPELNLISKKTDSDSQVFIYHISDDKFFEISEPEENNQETTEEENSITSDDVTADTSIKPIEKEEATTSETETVKETQNNEDYQLDDMYTDVLQGYAQYNEEEENTVSLEDFEHEFLKLEIRRPSKVLEQAYANLRSPAMKFNTGNNYSKYNGAEYSIAPLYSANYRSYKGFSAGTTFYQGIDTGELEQSSGVFSRYDHKFFAINTSYRRTINSTNNNYNDNLYFAPELKLNQYFTLREVFSTDVHQNTKKAEFILSINPFGNKDIDRLRVEFGASQSYSPTNDVIKNQFRFLTKFKL